MLILIHDDTYPWRHLLAGIISLSKHIFQYSSCEETVTCCWPSLGTNMLALPVPSLSGTGCEYAQKTDRTSCPCAPGPKSKPCAWKVLPCTLYFSSTITEHRRHEKDHSIPCFHAKLSLCLQWTEDRNLVQSLPVVSWVCILAGLPVIASWETNTYRLLKT